MEETSDSKRSRSNKLKEAQQILIAYLRDYHPTLGGCWTDHVKAEGAQIPAPKDQGISWPAHQLTPFLARIYGVEIPQDDRP
eukprot:1451506-Pyramimonas_sp.AAC.1